MNTSLSKKPVDKYIEVAYHTSIDNLPFNLKYNSTQWCLDEAAADKFISKVKDLEVLIEDYLKSNNMPYRTEFIILTFFKVIESVSGGLDVRSSLSNEEHAQRFCDHYHNNYNEALEFCNKTIAMYEADGKNHSYTKHWRDYDKHNELVSLYELGLRTFGEGDFEINLAKINETAQRLLDKLKSGDNDENTLDSVLKNC